MAGFANGEEFSGELQHDSPHGYGVAHLGNQKGTYEGQWLNGVRHGWAVSTVSNGDMWAGAIPPSPRWLRDLRRPMPTYTASEHGNTNFRNTTALLFLQASGLWAKRAGWDSCAWQRRESWLTST